MSFNIETDMSDARATGLQAKKGLLQLQYNTSRVMEKRNDKSGCSSAMITWDVIDGPQAGAQVNTFHPLPDSDHLAPELKEKGNSAAKNAWAKVLLSCGLSEAEMRTKKGVSSDHIVGRIAHLDYTPKEQTVEGKWAEVIWLTPTQFELRSKAAPAPHVKSDAGDDEIPF